MDGNAIFDLPTLGRSKDPHPVCNYGFKLKPHVGRSAKKIWQQFRPCIKKSLLFIFSLPAIRTTELTVHRATYSYVKTRDNHQPFSFCWRVLSCCCCCKCVFCMKTHLLHFRPVGKCYRSTLRVLQITRGQIFLVFPLDFRSTYGPDSSPFFDPYNLWRHYLAHWLEEQPISALVPLTFSQWGDDL